MQAKKQENGRRKREKNYKIHMLLSLFPTHEFILMAREAGDDPFLQPIAKGKGAFNLKLTLVALFFCVRAISASSSAIFAWISAMITNIR